LPDGYIPLCRYTAEAAAAEAEADAAAAAAAAAAELNEEEALDASLKAAEDAVPWSEEMVAEWDARADKILAAADKVQMSRSLSRRELEEYLIGPDMLPDERMFVEWLMDARGGGGNWGAYVAADGLITGSALRKAVNGWATATLGSSVSEEDGSAQVRQHRSMLSITQHTFLLSL